MLPMSTALSYSDRPLVTEQEVAALFMVAPRTVRRWAEAGVVTRIRVGGVSRYLREEIDGLLSREARLPDRGPVAQEHDAPMARLPSVKPERRSDG
jgi:hypothetical protein